MDQRLQEIMNQLEAGNPPPADAGLFGATIPQDAAAINIIGVPWDVTTSFAPGTHAACEALRFASHQLDLEDAFFGKVYRTGISYEILPEVLDWNKKLRVKAERAISALESGRVADPSDLGAVNEASDQLNELVYRKVQKVLRSGKKIGILGGDHSVPFGCLKALGEQHNFGVLHIDAHHDLRKAYEGFHHSHASIFYNVLNEVPAVEKLVSVAIRDFSHEEKSYAAEQKSRIRTFYDEELVSHKMHGRTWDDQAAEIIAALPSKVYVSIDIDGLDQVYCPNTGTPVPGGLTFHEACYLIQRLAKSGKDVVGFDLVEVGAEPWDVNVGARLLYKLCGMLVAP